MDYSLKISLRARVEIEESIVWYERKRAGLGSYFLEQLDSLFERIKKNPYQFPLKHAPFREAIMPVFPFVIIFEQQEKDILIYAVFNTHRNPSQKP